MKWINDRKRYATLRENIENIRQAIFIFHGFIRNQNIFMKLWITYYSPNGKPASAKMVVSDCVQ